MYTLAERTRPSFSFHCDEAHRRRAPLDLLGRRRRFHRPGHALSDWAARQDFWPKARYVTYQFLTTLSWRKALPQNTVVVLVDDDEYWRGEPARRVPIKRAYLAKLLRAI